MFLTGLPGLNQPPVVQASEELRLNTSIPPCTTSCSTLGVIGGDLAGYPNGRRLTDDVIDVSLKVVEGCLIDTAARPTRSVTAWTRTTRRSRRHSRTSASHTRDRAWRRGSTRARRAGNDDKMGARGVRRPLGPLRARRSTQILLGVTNIGGVGDLAFTPLPTSKDQCKDGGWQRFSFPRAFKNQGDCIQFVNTGK